MSDKKYGMLTSWLHGGYYFEISDANRFQKHLPHSVKMWNEYCIINISEGDIFLLLYRNVTVKHWKIQRKKNQTKMTKWISWTQICISVEIYFRPLINSLNQILKWFTWIFNISLKVGRIASVFDIKYSSLKFLFTVFFLQILHQCLKQIIIKLMININFN